MAHERFGFAQPPSGLPSLLDCQAAEPLRLGVVSVNLGGYLVERRSLELPTPRASSSRAPAAMATSVAAVGRMFGMKVCRQLRQRCAYLALPYAPRPPALAPLRFEHAGEIIALLLALCFRHLVQLKPYLTQPAFCGLGRPYRRRRLFHVVRSGWHWRFFNGLQMRRCRPPRVSAGAGVR